MTLRLGGDGAITGCTSLENPDLTVSGLTISGSFDAEKVLVASGTAAAPSYTFSGDTDNGLYYAGTNSIGVSTAGTSAIVVDASQQVGIGTSSPSAKLHVSSTAAVEALVSGGGTSGDTVLHLKGNGNAFKFIVPNSASQYGMGLYDVSNAAYRMFVDSSGNIGIGTTGPSAPLHVEKTDATAARIGGSSYYLDLGQYGTGSSPAITYNGSGASLVFRGGSTERMRIDSSGNVGIGTTSPGQPLAVVATSSTYKGMELITPTGDGSGEFIFGVHQNGSTAGRSIVFKRGGSDGTATESLRIDSSGRLLMGTSSAPTAGNGQYGRLVIQGYIGDSTAGAYINLQRGQPATTPLVANNEIARINFSDSVGNDFANIGCYVDGTTGSGDYPGRLTFFTTADGASSPTERMRIDSSGVINSNNWSFNGLGTTTAANCYLGTFAPGSSAMAFATGGSERMRIRSDGYINAGGFIGSAYHRFNGINASGGDAIFVVSGYQSSGGTNQDSLIVSASNDSANPNSATSTVRVFREASNQRSINAAGTINASGADYAEYMTKAGNFMLAKGDICGINSEGKLTNVFADAISFVVKSTDPSYVGGDVWHKSVGVKPGGYDDDRTEEEIAAATVIYEEALEAARQLVDRIAFSGQVPVNVRGASAGQFIVPVKTADGGITGEAKNEADLTLSEYIKAIGKVIAIEDDGRARIIVKVA